MQCTAIYLRLRLNATTGRDGVSSFSRLLVLLHVLLQLKSAFSTDLCKDCGNCISEVLWLINSLFQVPHGYNIFHLV
jgi:hypothetical protein